jgi:hypothetical protein
MDIGLNDSQRLTLRIVDEARAAAVRGELAALLGVNPGGALRATCQAFRAIGAVDIAVIGERAIARLALSPGRELPDEFIAEFAAEIRRRGAELDASLRGFAAAP